MRSDLSLDQEVRTLESRIRDRRAALRESLDELRRSAADTKARVRQRATSPLVWGAALVIGFVAARFARRRPEPMQATLRVGKPEPGSRKLLGAVLSALLPLGLRIAQRSAAPWIARALHGYQHGYARRRAY